MEGLRFRKYGNVIDCGVEGLFGSCLVVGHRSECGRMPVVNECRSAGCMGRSSVLGI